MLLFFSQHRNKLWIVAAKNGTFRRVQSKRNGGGVGEMGVPRNIQPSWQKGHRRSNCAQRRGSQPSRQHHPQFLGASFLAHKIGEWRGARDRKRKTERQRKRARERCCGTLPGLLCALQKAAVLNPQKTVHSHHL